MNSAVEFIYKSPIRALYFVFSPFPWDISKGHFVGLLDSSLYLFLFYLIICNRKIILNDTANSYFFIISLLLFCIWDWG